MTKPATVHQHRCGHRDECSKPKHSLCLKGRYRAIWLFQREQHELWQKAVERVLVNGCV